MAATNFRRVKGVLPKASNIGGAPATNAYNILDRIGRAHIREHRKTIATWTGEAPGFSHAIAQDDNNIILTVFLDGSEKGRMKYHWIDRGTQPHDIYPTRAEFLVFRSPYFPATEPRVIGSKQASRGDDINIRYSVRHPGVEAREFTDTINQNLAEHDRRLLEQLRPKLK